MTHNMRVYIPLTAKRLNFHNRAALERERESTIAAKIFYNADTAIYINVNSSRAYTTYYLVHSNLYTR